MFKQVLLREAKYSVLDNTVSILRLLIIEVKERKNIQTVKYSGALIFK